MMSETIAQPPPCCKPKVLKKRIKTAFALHIAHSGGIISGVPVICAIFTHFNSRERTLTCLSRLAQQTRRPEHIVIINNGSVDDSVLPEARSLAETSFPAGTLHILQMEKNLGNAGGCARGLDYAFGTLKADFTWVLDDDSWPRPRTLENLLAAPAESDTVRMSAVIDPTKGDELSWPLTITGNGPDHWKNAIRRCELPPGNLIPSRGGWLGALYPREAWHRADLPTEALFIRGEDEEYPWKVRAAGFKFITVLNSELEHPSAAIPLIHYRIAHRSFFYEPGLHISRQYYKTRNWAWLQRLRAPYNYPRRLVACGFYIILSLNAMLRCGEISIPRIYNLFRALHNGFYGKLRPY